VKDGTNKHTVADATLFEIMVSYSGVAKSMLERHALYFLEVCDVDVCILKLTGSLLAVELSCCGCVEIKVCRGNVPFSHSNISVALNCPVSSI
jgi:hypothetical protein